MNARTLYRISAVLLVLFAIGHTLGFASADPKWGIDALLATLRGAHFDADGFTRTWWDFYLATGYISGLFYLFAAVLAWQLAGLPGAALARLRIASWAFALCFAAIAVVSVLHLFLIPIAFAAATTLSLSAAAWMAARTPSDPVE